MSKKIKNIVFDLGGVIVPLNLEACSKAFAGIGFTDIGNRLGLYLQKGFFLGYEKGEITTEEFREIVKGFIELSMRESITDAKIDIAMGAFIEKIDSKVIELLKNLKRRYRLFLLSNTNPIAIGVVKGYFLEHGVTLEECFDDLFFSYEMKMAKPDSIIYRTMLEGGQMRASETLFIDDTPVNIEAAESMGIKTLLFTQGNNLVEELNRRLNES